MPFDNIVKLADAVQLAAPCGGAGPLIHDDRWPGRELFREAAKEAVNLVMDHPETKLGGYGRDKLVLGSRDGVGNYPDRKFIEMFLLEFRNLTAPGSICLEWSTMYTDNFFSDRCAQKWSFVYKGDVSDHRVDSATKTIYSDITVLSTTLSDAGLESMFFDTIICTQVMEHVPRPPELTNGLFRILKPGGLLYLTAPGLSFFHGVPNHYYSPTTDALSMLVAEAGFCEKAVRKGGSHYIAAAYGLGMTLHDMARKEWFLDAYGTPNNHYTMQTGVFSLAERPLTPSASCEKVRGIRRILAEPTGKGYGWTKTADRL